MKVLILSKDYYFNPTNKRTITAEAINKLNKNNINTEIIALNHPCYTYDTAIIEEEHICTVQKYPFPNASESFWECNIRAQEGIMLYLKNGYEFDYIIIDGIDFALAAHSYSKTYNVPIIYMNHPQDNKNDKLMQIEKWIAERSTYVINSESSVEDKENTELLILVKTLERSLKST